jgi:hypothetical protein
MARQKKVARRRTVATSTRSKKTNRSNITIPVADQASSHITKKPLKKSSTIAGPTSSVLTLKNPTSMIPEPYEGAWENTRELVFTDVQLRYAPNLDADTPSGGLSIHDVVMLCPNLESLTFTIPGSICTKESPVKKTIRQRSGPEVERATQLFRIFEHPKLRNLNLRCMEKLFRPLARAFKSKSTRCGRAIELRIDASHPTDANLSYDHDGIKAQKCYDFEYGWSGA